MLLVPTSSFLILLMLSTTAMRQLVRRRFLAAVAALSALPGLRGVVAARPVELAGVVPSSSPPGGMPEGWLSDAALMKLDPGLKERVEFERRVMPSGWQYDPELGWWHSFLPGRGQGSK